MLHRTVQNVLLSLLLLIALTVLAEFVVGWVYLPAGPARARPLIGVEELSRALGPGVLKRMLLGPSH